MIQVITKHPIDSILQNPKLYISEDFDKPILKIVHGETSEPTLLLLGYDEQENLYYFTFEDSETSEDFYCDDGDLAKMFDEIMQGKGDYGIWVRG